MPFIEVSWRDLKIGQIRGKILGFAMPNFSAPPLTRGTKIEAPPKVKIIENLKTPWYAII